MIWVLGALALLIVLPIVLLIPRIRFFGYARPGEYSFSLKGLFFSFSYTNIGGMQGRMPFLGRKESASKPAAKSASTKTRISFSIPKWKKKSGNSTDPVGDETSKGRRKSEAREPFSRELTLLMIKQLLQLIWKLIKCINADYIRVWFTVATPDPMWTGVCFGAIQPVMAWNNPPKREFHLLISFERESPTGEAEWSFSVRPIRILFVLFVWIWRLPLLRLWREWRGS